MITNDYPDHDGRGNHKVTLQCSSCGCYAPDGFGPSTYAAWMNCKSGARTSGWTLTENTALCRNCNNDKQHAKGIVTP